MAGPNRNNPWLDLVRSAAIILVLLRHGERAVRAKDGSETALQTFFTNGWVGVDLFFVLSGYLIAKHLLRVGAGSDQFSIGRYLAMRALRIVPAYFAVLALVALGVFPLFAAGPEMLGLRIGYHILFLQDYLPSDINVVFWSLGVEEKFYLLAPLLIFFLLRAKSDWVRGLVLLACFCLPIAFRTAAYLRIDGPLDYSEFWPVFRSPFHMTLEGLVVGVGIAIAQHGGLVSVSRRAGLTALVGGSAVFALWLASHNFMANISWADAVPQPALVALMAGVIVVGAVQLSPFPMPLTSTFHLIAKLSYCLYLIHYPLIPLATEIGDSVGVFGFWASYLTMSMGAAVLLHLAVERPFLKIKDRIGKKTQASAAGSTGRLQTPA